MPFNIQPFNFKLTGKDLGGFDLHDAIQKGFKSYKDYHEAANTPKRLSEALLAAQLQNKINKPKAEDAQNWYELEKRGLSDTHGLSGLNQQLLQQKVNQGISDQKLNDFITNGGRTSDQGDNAGVTAEGPGANLGEPTVANTFPGRTGKPTPQSVGNEIIAPSLSQNMTNGMAAPTVQATGNPNLYHIDDLIQGNPHAAALLKKQGMEIKRNVKYDPKTGVTSVVTQYPSGKVTVSASGVKANGGKSPLTTKTLSSLQSAKVAIPQLKAVIDKLIATPSPVHPKLPYGAGDLWRPGARKEHDDLVNLGKDLFAKAKGLTTTEKALETGAKTLDRGNFQSDATYHAALLKTKALLDSDEKEINDAINQGVFTGKTPPASNESKELHYNPKTGRLE